MPDRDFDLDGENAAGDTSEIGGSIDTWAPAAPNGAPDDPMPITGVVSPTGHAHRDDLIVLDPTSPLEAALIDMVRVSRKKRADYAVDGEWDSNFRGVSDLMGLTGFERTEAAYSNVLQKVMRLRSLRMNGRMNDPKNESVDDTYLDLAVWAVITLASRRDERG